MVSWSEQLLLHRASPTHQTTNHLIAAHRRVISTGICGRHKTKKDETKYNPPHPTSPHGEYLIYIKQYFSHVSSSFISVVRNRVKYAQFRKKRMNTNPGKGPYHFKSPARMVWRTIRGMCNHKSARGKEALGRLSTFEGIPHPFDKKKRVVVPAAIRAMRLKTIRDFTVLGELADSIGWKHKDLLKKLEDKRKVKAEGYYQKSQAKALLKQKAEEAAAGDLAKVNEVLAASGY